MRTIHRPIVLSAIALSLVLGGCSQNRRDGGVLWPTSSAPSRGDDRWEDWEEAREREAKAREKERERIAKEREKEAREREKAREKEAKARAKANHGNNGKGKAKGRNE